MFFEVQQDALRFTRRIHAATAELKPGFWQLTDLVEATPGGRPVRQTHLAIPTTLDATELINRFVNPVPLESVGIGVLLATLASVGNLVTGQILIRAGRRHRSITLEADGKHLMTDVWTSVGVLAGIGVVAVTHLVWLDPLIALGVGINIVFTGVGLVRRSVVGLLDATLPPDEVAIIQRALVPLTDDPRVHLTDLRTRESGRQRFVQATLTVPGEWTVRRGHELDRVLRVFDKKLSLVAG